MKTTKLSMVSGTFGCSVILVSTIQWFFLHPDLSQFLLGSSIGFIFLVFAYLHSWMRNVDEDIKDTNKGLDNLNMWFRDELNKINIQLNKQEVKQK